MRHDLGKTLRVDPRDFTSLPLVSKELSQLWRERQRQRHKIKNLIDRVRKNKRAARAARTYEQVRAFLCKTTT